MEHSEPASGTTDGICTGRSVRYYLWLFPPARHPDRVHFKILEQQTLPQVRSTLQSLCLFENYAQASVPTENLREGRQLAKKVKCTPITCALIKVLTTLGGCVIM
jgi:hypothetical protein